jgi:hypothetical protein
LIKRVTVEYFPGRATLLNHINPLICGHSDLLFYLRALSRRVSPVLVFPAVIFSPENKPEPAGFTIKDENKSKYAAYKRIRVTFQVQSCLEHKQNNGG